MYIHRYLKTLNVTYRYIETMRCFFLLVNIYWTLKFFIRCFEIQSLTQILIEIQHAIYNCWRLSYQIFIEIKYSKDFNMLTELTYDSAVFKIFLNVITICIFIDHYLIEIVYEILISVMSFTAIYAIKVPVWKHKYFKLSNLILLPQSNWKLVD